MNSAWKLSVGIALSALLVGASSAQRVEHPRPRDDRFRNPHWVYDTRHHLNHYYPAHGEVVVGLPAGAIAIRFHDERLFFHGGVWFRPSGARFVVIAPPIGVVVPVLPPAYVTLQVAGVPYYYADGAYYTPTPGGYAVTAPPPGVESAAPAPPPAPEPVIYPRNHQSPAQTDADRGACAQWATQQATGKDASVYQRAFAACMDGRGYTVK